MKIAIAFAIAFMALSGTVMAATTVTVTYTEPSQTVGGSPITDLKEIAIYLKQDAKAEVRIAVPATKASGGGNGSKVITVADPPVCGSTVVSVTAAAVNTTGLEGPRAGPVSTTRDVSKLGDCLKLKAPSNLTITIQ